MQVSSEQFGVMDHSCPLTDSHFGEQRTMEDASESHPVIELEIRSKQHTVLQLVAINSSLAAIHAVCDRTRNCK